MSIWDKVKKAFTDEEDDEVKDKEQSNTSDEEVWVNRITTDQENAESIRTGLDDIEQVWEDEYKIFVGGGKQWETSFAYRSKRSRQIRPNSEDNLVFLSIMNLHANITSNTPQVVVEGTGEEDDEVAKKLTYLCQFNDKRNKFPALWKRVVQQYLCFGPAIAGVLWDSEWTGGTGPDRWVGDVRVCMIDRREIFFDPAAINLEERLQECAFVTRRFRKKLSWIAERWPKKGKFVAEEINEEDLQDEGMDPRQAYVIEYWHRGKPWTVPEQSSTKLKERAAEALAINDIYQARDLEDMAKGELVGIHVAYVANGIFLGYEPYVYDDGLYPFIYKALYFDENSQFGFGEIRNIKIPQVMHNKADEIEIEAYSREGLGGGYYEDGGITPKQLDEIKQNSGKGGMWFKVQNIHKMKDREGVKAPASLITYKEHKQRMIETVSSVTPIQQGISPGATVPYSSIRELGARTDIRTKSKIEVLEDFLVELNRLRINRFKQFYTEDRYYRLKGKFGKLNEGRFRADEMYRQWDRETVMNEETGEEETRFEAYIPEFDVSVKITDEKPNDREYYTKMAFELLKVGGMTIEDVWATIDEGEFPPKDQVLENLRNQQMQQVPPGGGVIQQQQGRFDIDAFLDTLPDEVIAQLQQMPPEEQAQQIQALIQQQQMQQVPGQGGMSGATSQG